MLIILIKYYIFLKINFLQVEGGIEYADKTDMAKGGKGA